MSDKKAEGIKEGAPIWVESLLSSEEWVASRKQHPNTHHLKDKPTFFKSEYEWRWRMGAGIPEDERNLINKRLDDMRKKVKNENTTDN